MADEPLATLIDAARQWVDTLRSTSFGDEDDRQADRIEAAIAAVQPARGTRHNHAYTPEERSLAIDRSVPAKVAAEQLGRTVGAIKSMRRTSRRNRYTSDGSDD